MSRNRDFQIWWIVLAAGFFWVVIWQHEIVSKWSHTAFTAAVAMTSRLRPVSQPPAASDAEPDETKRAPGKAAAKRTSATTTAKD
jgi:hypothetical protein